MNKLEELRAYVAKQFEQAEDKDGIERLATLNNIISDVEAEQNELIKGKADAIKAYKDLVKHTSFNDPEKAPVDNAVGEPVPKFEDFLNKYAVKEQ